ncbi:glycoside hydrolase [Thraustotheca clavata]|uniref:Glycoside hydrolase n=1 Tax=Thraustotheca clavata TaxID=74557 RepID=A0A1V9YYE1_9STRA|nr:glycoside hydrolase [Thraustotheca clavata]
MKITLCIGALFAGATVNAITPAEPGTPAFLKHRPVFHFLARKNWMNDPCAPYYDDATGLYHLFYQFNTQQTVWGNMTWGHAVSHDQATWIDYPDALKNEDANDFLGVFSGFAARKAVNGKDTVFYTGVTKLPISFKLPYLFGEHVNYATTSDGGKTWQKGSKPVIAEPPSGLNVTGWRDPYPFDSPALDAIYRVSNGHYLITAGGIHDVGPRIFLYHSNDYINWEYKGFLLSQEKNTSFSPFSGSWGYNFETTNFIELTDEEGKHHNVMMFAAEGIPNRYPMWAIGTLEAHDNCGDNSNGLFQPKMVGVSEYSSWYANAVYVDPKTNKHVVIGWITEDNGFTDEQPQGWNGILSVPREVSIAIVKDIYDPSDKFNAPGDYLVTNTKTLNNGKVVKTIKTLGIKAYESIKLLRGDQVETLNGPTNVVDEKVLDTKSKSFELYAEVTSFQSGSKVGFAVRRSDDNTEHTTIVYDDTTKKIVINRSASSTGQCDTFTATAKPNSANTEGFFHLFDKVNQQGQVSREPLRFNIFVDVSVVEVFVNDRFALSARIYPCESASSASNGISLVGPGTFENVKVWGNAKHAWPETRTVSKQELYYLVV